MENVTIYLTDATRTAPEKMKIIRQPIKKKLTSATIQICLLGLFQEASSIWHIWHYLLSDIPGLANLVSFKTKTGAFSRLSLGLLGKAIS